MAEDLLARVLREIRERKQAAEHAVRESQRLERALAALASQPASSAGATSRTARQQRRPPRARRAAPGANRDAILAIIRDRPGVTAGEIVQASRIPRSTVAPTLSRLTHSGALERAELPSGGAGFRLARQPDAIEAGPVPERARSSTRSAANSRSV